MNKWVSEWVSDCLTASPSRTLSFSHTNIDAHAHTFSFSPTDSPTFPFSLRTSLTHTHTHPLSLSLSLSLRHAHALSNKHSLSLIFTHTSRSSRHVGAPDVDSELRWVCGPVHHVQIDDALPPSLLLGEKQEKGGLRKLCNPTFPYFSSSLSHPPTHCSLFPSFLPSLFPSFPLSFYPSYLPSFLPSFLPTLFPSYQIYNLLTSSYCSPSLFRRFPNARFWTPFSTLECNPTTFQVMES